MSARIIFNWDFSGSGVFGVWLEACAFIANLMYIVYIEMYPSLRQWTHTHIILWLWRFLFYICYLRLATCSNNNNSSAYQTKHEGILNWEWREKVVNMYMLCGGKIQAKIIRQTLEVFSVSHSIALYSFSVIQPLIMLILLRFFSFVCE